MKKLFIGTLAACLLVGTAAYADPIVDRKAAMKKVGGSMGAAVKMLKGQMDYDPAVALEAFTTMNTVAKGFGELFPVGSETGGETTANPKIWSDADGFKAALVKFDEDTAAAMEAKPADMDAFKAAFGKVAGNCKSCHETYRVAKQ